MKKTTQLKPPEPYYHADTWLTSWRSFIDARHERMLSRIDSLTGESGLREFALGYLYYGLHRSGNNYILREYAPNATEIFVTGSFSEWQTDEQYRMQRVAGTGNWEIELPAQLFSHETLYRLLIRWNGGEGERLPSYATRVVQDDDTKIFSAQVWDPPNPYRWRQNRFTPADGAPIIYEVHPGMATEEERIGTWKEFTRKILPTIAASGYNTIQLMAVQEHPFYGSFGYHISNFFAASSRFGTPDDLKELVDTAHRYGLRVIMDLVHSHSVRNVNEGLALFDGSPGLYFHEDERRLHKAWDSLCFNYGSDHVLHFLLSNCSWWLNEYRFDGFRFDGVTSMIYYDHGLERDFTTYLEYFDGKQDEDAIIYLTMANMLVQCINPSVITIAEEMSGMPGIAAPAEKKGFGFDYRMAMGVPDYWIKLVKDLPDEEWNTGRLFFELRQRRPEERVIGYCESHDQALVGDKTLMFRMVDADIYTNMTKESVSLKVDRGMALHKMIRLITFGTAGGGYLTFMGNEFGHPEWIDFPREGNNYSYKNARRQWSLRDDKSLRYHLLADFEKAMLKLQADYQILEKCDIEPLAESHNDKIIAFLRGALLFVFNFHPANSYTGYGIKTKGRFKLILNTDDKIFGGFGHIDNELTYQATQPGNRKRINDPYYLNLYLPARSGQVYRKLPVKGIRDL